MDWGDPAAATALWVFPAGMQRAGGAGRARQADDLGRGVGAVLPGQLRDGRPVIHHGPQYQVMTNSPVFDQQLALNAYWDLVGGDNMLPGTISGADRFVRLSYNPKRSPQFEDRTMAVASVFSQMRAVGVTLGLQHRDHPGISTLWRAIADHDA